MNKNIKKSTIIALTASLLINSMNLSVFAEESSEGKSQIQVNEVNDITTKDSVTVNILDSNLKSAVYKALGKKESAKITSEDMQKLGELEVKNVGNLSGIEYAVNLTKLKATNGKISDLSPLKNLTKLKSLDLKSNKISEGKYLENLKNLTYLNLDENNISDVSQISKFFSDEIASVQSQIINVNRKTYNNKITTKLDLVNYQGEFGSFWYSSDDFDFKQGSFGYLTFSNLLKGNNSGTIRFDSRMGRFSGNIYLNI